MSSKVAIRGVYAILDAGVSAGEDLVRFAREYLQGGIRILQVRDKTGERREEIARGVGSLKGEFDFIFIVNDDPALARSVGADGVHVGKGDASIEECKRTLVCRGEVSPGGTASLTSPLLVGYSAHSLEEALEAERRGADYVAFGAVFPTPTKGPGHPVQGLEKLKEVVCALKVPVVAIGGINRINVSDVLKTGVASVAMISALALAKDRVEGARFFSRLFL